MDLSKFNTKDLSDKGAVMVVEDPTTGKDLLTDDDEPVTITLLGKDSKVYRELSHKRTNQQLEQAVRSKKAKVSAEEMEGDALDILAACTTGWSHIEDEGESLECSRINARKMYEKYPWLKEQADSFILDRSNYLGN